MLPLDIITVYDTSSWYCFQLCSW